MFVDVELSWLPPVVAIRAAIANIGMASPTAMMAYSVNEAPVSSRSNAISERTPKLPRNHLGRHHEDDIALVVLIIRRPEELAQDWKVA